MFDSNEETCWNSDQGSPQWVLLDFPQAVRVSELQVQFQGGFAGKTCRVEGCLKDGDFEKLTDFYPEDKHSLQISFVAFPIWGAPPSHRLKIVFENSTDFFGRVVVYALDVLGERA
ncbi:NR2CA protein, partial [Atractosteus spatula]|nr:NR2CA protein [Atractosteus spatula]